jgi:hypothetical protein
LTQQIKHLHLSLSALLGVSLQDLRRDLVVAVQRVIFVCVYLLRIIFHLDYNVDALELDEQEFASTCPLLHGGSAELDALLVYVSLFNSVELLISFTLNVTKLCLAEFAKLADYVQQKFHASVE